jgi:hypothetical protein
VSKDETEKVLSALDTLAFALEDHGHRWTDRERQLYVRAVAILQRKDSKPKRKE